MHNILAVFSDILAIFLHQKTTLETQNTLSTTNLQQKNTMHRIQTFFDKLFACSAPRMAISRKTNTKNVQNKLN